MFRSRQTEVTPDIDGTRVIWRGGGGTIHWVDLTDPALTDRLVNGAQIAASEPALSGDLVVFDGPLSNPDPQGINYSDVYTANLASGDVRLVSAQPGTPVSLGISGAIAAWLDYDFDTGERKLYAKQVYSPAPPVFVGLGFNARVDGTKVVYDGYAGTSGGGVWVYEHRQSGPPMSPPRPPRP